MVKLKVLCRDYSALVMFLFASIGCSGPESDSLDLSIKEKSTVTEGALSESVPAPIDQPISDASGAALDDRELTIFGDITEPQDDQSSLANENQSQFISDTEIDATTLDDIADGLAEPTPSVEQDDVWKKTQALISFAQFGSAIENLNGILDASPSFVEALLARARCFEILSKYELAGKDYDKALEIAPGCSEVLLCRAFGLLNDNPKYAKQLATGALEIDETSVFAQAINAASEAAMLFGQLDSKELQAIGFRSVKEKLQSNSDLVSKILASNPTDPRTLASVGSFHSFCGLSIILSTNNSPAEVELKAAIDHFSKSVSMHTAALEREKNLVESLGTLFQIGLIFGLDRELGKKSLEKLVSLSRAQSVVHGQLLAAMCWQNDYVSDRELAFWCEQVLVRIGGELKAVVRELSDKSNAIYNQGTYAIAMDAATGVVNRQLEEQVRETLRASLFYKRVLDQM